MVPKNWNNVTIEQYLAFKKSEETICEDELDEHDLRVKQVCLLTGIEPDEVMKWTNQELMKIEDLKKVPLPTKIVNQFRLSGNLYTFKMNPNIYTGSEYCALMNACKEGGLKNIHRLCFLISQPRKWYGKKMTLEANEVEERIEHFKQLPLSIAYPMADFFLQLSNELMKDIREFSDGQIAKMTKTQQAAHDSLKDMAGL